MATVYAPNKQYSGLSAGVMFVNGVGETDNASLIEWFIRKGYAVDGAPAIPVIETANEEHDRLLAENERLQARVVDLEQALEIANDEIGRLSPPPPAAEAGAPIEPAEEATPETAKPARKGK